MYPLGYTGVQASAHFRNEHTDTGSPPHPFTGRNCPLSAAAPHPLQAKKTLELTANALQHHGWEHQHCLCSLRHSSSHASFTCRDPQALDAGLSPLLSLKGCWQQRSMQVISSVQAWPKHTQGAATGSSARALRLSQGLGK